MSLRTLLLAGAATASLVGAATLASAQSTDDIGVELLQLLVDEGVLPREKAQQLMERARTAATLRAQREAPRTAATIDVPYVPQALRDQIRDEVKQEVVAQAKSERWIAPNSLPDWLDRISLSGDFRLRYEAERDTRVMSNISGWLPAACAGSSRRSHPSRQSFETSPELDTD